MQRLTHQLRSFQSSATVCARRRNTRNNAGAPGSKLTPKELFDLQDIPEFADEDTSGAGHVQLAHERHVLRYLRLIDGEVQQLKGTLYCRPIICG